VQSDGHSLVALCAPRLVFLNGGSDGDAWQDPRGMWLAGANANPVYHLIGRQGLELINPVKSGTAPAGGFAPISGGFHGRASL